MTAICNRYQINESDPIRKAIVQSVENIKEQARREVFDGYQITERSADNAIVRARAREVYFPVHFLEPFAGNEAALGFDLASNPTRRGALGPHVREVFPGGFDGYTGPGGTEFGLSICKAII